MISKIWKKEININKMRYKSDIMPHSIIVSNLLNVWQINKFNLILKITD